VKKKRIPYTQLTLKWLRREGFMCEVVERWVTFGPNPKAGGPPGIRRDLFNIIDIIAIKPGCILGVQSTSCGARDAHIHKIQIEKAANLTAWLESGAGLWLVSWEKPEHRWLPIVDKFGLEPE
jgi:hypothetical protein